MRKILFALGFAALIVGTIIWGIGFGISLQQYEEYVELVSAQELGQPQPYYIWGSGKYVNITFVALCLLWIPFIDYSLRKKTYPFLRQKLTIRGMKSFCRSVSRSLYEDLYGLVLGYFTRVNRRVRAKIGLWFMKIETFEHVHLLTKVFKWIVLPSIVLYGFADFYVFKQNPLDATLISVIAVLLFFYSNFVPDLPAIFRRRIYRDVRDTLQNDLPWYKTYGLLLFAPLFIMLVFCGVKIKWKTTETFHNFKSLAVYGCFLFVLSFLVLLAFPISVANIVEAVCVPLYAILGYLTHLRVDMLF